MQKEEMNTHTHLFKHSVIGLTSMTIMCSPLALAADHASGKATVYSGHFAGKKTANGQTYDPNKLTGASRTLPIGSKVQVKNKKTGKAATVTINDKPAKGTGSVVDLSKGAADKIGVKGTAPVDAKVVGGSK
jgi:rare lipoprotein A